MRRKLGLLEHCHYRLFRKQLFHTVCQLITKYLRYYIFSEDTTSQTKKKSDPSKKSSNPPQTTRPSTQPQEPSRRSKEPQKIPEDNGSTSDTPTIPEVDEPSTEDEPRDSIVKEQRSYASMAIPPSQRPSASGSITGPKDPDTADPPGPVESTHSIKPLVLFVKTPKKKAEKKGEEKVPNAGSPSDGNG